MKYPLEKRRPSTHHERLHRDIALILETRYNEPHSGDPYVDTEAESDAWYSMLNQDDQEWARELFQTEIYNPGQSDRDRVDMLNTLCRWDCQLAATIAVNLLKNLPIEENLQLQNGIIFCRCFPFGEDTEKFLLMRFGYWEKKLFLYAHQMDWTMRSPATDLVTGIACIIGLNSFNTGLRLYPRCVSLAHRGLFYDMRFLCFLTRDLPIAKIRSYPPISPADLDRLRQCLLSQDPKYVKQLKERQKGWSSPGKPLNLIISGLNGEHKQTVKRFES